jgi:hypothetical protein
LGAFDGGDTGSYLQGRIDPAPEGVNFKYDKTSPLGQGPADLPADKGGGGRFDIPPDRYDPDVRRSAGEFPGRLGACGNQQPLTQEQYKTKQPDQKNQSPRDFFNGSHIFILPGQINNLALKFPREPVSGLLGIKPLSTNESYKYPKGFAGECQM